MRIGRRGALVAAFLLVASGCAVIGRSHAHEHGLTTPPPTPEAALRWSLDPIFNDPLLSRALVDVRVDALDTQKTIYAREAGKLVVPASNLKLLTLAVAAQRLGWDYTFETRLDATGVIADGVLHGDLIAVGGGIRRSRVRTSIRRPCSSSGPMR